METKVEYITEPVERPTVHKSAVLALLADRPIAYHPLLAKILGGVKQAIFVSQMLYWTGKGKRPDGYIWKTQEEWTDETGLSPAEQRTARKHLVQSGILQEQRRGIPARLYYRLNTDALQAALLEYHEQDVKDIEILPSTTSTTIPEITSESTTEEPAAPDSSADDLWPTDRQTSAEKLSAAEFLSRHAKDPVGLMIETEEKRAEVEHPDFADPAHDIDPWLDKPVKEWCKFARLPYEDQPVTRLRTFAKDLRELAEPLGKMPKEVAQALKSMRESPMCEWMRSAGRPTHRGVQETLINVLFGQVLLTEQGKGGSSTPRREPVIASDTVVIGI